MSKKRHRKEDKMLEGQSESVCELNSHSSDIIPVRQVKKNESE